MNKTEASSILDDGKCVTHLFFKKGEFIYAVNGDLFNEKNEIINKKKFWLSYSNNEEWNEGWSIYTDDNIK